MLIRKNIPNVISGLKSQIFITVGKRSAACGFRTTYQPLPERQNSEWIRLRSSALQADVRKCHLIRRSRPAVMKMKPSRAKFQLLVLLLSNQASLCLGLSCLKLSKKYSASALSWKERI